MRKGFTLIELLVVMAIIAILAALLMPAFQQAREQAKRTQCRNHLKEVASALQMYSSDTGSMPKYNNLQDVQWTDMQWEDVTGRKSQRLVGGTVVQRRGSLDLLVPDYLADIRMLQCPSDEGSPKLMLEYQPGEGETGRAANPTVGINLDMWYDEEVKVENHFGNDYFWGLCDPYENPRSKACKYAGLQRADHVSYVYTGEESVDSHELENPSRLRIMADNEEEGDEKPYGGMPLLSEMSSGAVNWQPDFETDTDAGGAECRGNLPTGLIHYRGYEPFSEVERWASWSAMDLGVAYYYVGALEKADNHSRSGVNVLYQDWHVEFDSRAWPAPIGWKNTTRFPRQKWTTGSGSAMAGCENTTYLPRVKRASEQMD